MNTVTCFSSKFSLDSHYYYPVLMPITKLRYVTTSSNYLYFYFVVKTCRSYYRCTHHKLYKCKAKKQVQRLNNDPTTLEILYRGEHTCHMSSTAPSIPPPSLQLFVNQQHHISPFHDHHSMITNIPHNSSHLWRHTLDHQHQQDHHHHHHHRHQLYGLSSSSSSTGSSSSNVLCNSTNTRAGLSTAGSIQQGGLGSGNQIHVPTDDSWIDVFNSGRSGSNALELIFTPTHDTNDS